MRKDRPPPYQGKAREDRTQVQPSPGTGTGSGAGSRTEDHDPGALGGTDMRSGAARAGAPGGLGSGLQPGGMVPSNAGFGGAGQINTPGASSGLAAGNSGSKRTPASR